MDSLRRSLVGTDSAQPTPPCRVPALILFPRCLAGLAPALSIACVAAILGALWWIIATTPWLLGFAVTVAAAAGWCYWLSDEPQERGAAGRGGEQSW